MKKEDSSTLREQLPKGGPGSDGTDPGTPKKRPVLRRGRKRVASPEVTVDDTKKDKDTKKNKDEKPKRRVKKVSGVVKNIKPDAKPEQTKEPEPEPENVKPGMIIRKSLDAPPPIIRKEGELPPDHWALIKGAGVDIIPVDKDGNPVSTEPTGKKGAGGTSGTQGIEWVTDDQFKQWLAVQEMDTCWDIVMRNKQYLALWSGFYAFLGHAVISTGKAGWMATKARFITTSTAASEKILQKNKISAPMSAPLTKAELTAIRGNLIGMRGVMAGWKYTKLAAVLFMISHYTGLMDKLTKHDIWSFSNVLSTY